MGEALPTGSATVPTAIGRTDACAASSRGLLSGLPTTTSTGAAHMVSELFDTSSG
jgi:hypothetical protein